MGTAALGRRFRADDEAIAGKMRAALGRDAYLDQDMIRGSVRHGLVCLYGGTDSLFEKERAEEVASLIRGVVAVRNRLVSSDVRPPKADARTTHGTTSPSSIIISPEVRRRRSFSDTSAPITSSITTLSSLTRLVQRIGKRRSHLILYPHRQI